MRVATPSVPPTDRPDCHGSGSRATTGQVVPLAECRACPHVETCCQLRLVRVLERAMPGLINTLSEVRVW
jgi:hypothetical protein